MFKAFGIRNYTQNDPLHVFSGLFSNKNDSWFNEVAQKLELFTNFFAELWSFYKSLKELSHLFLVFFVLNILYNLCHVQTLLSDGLSDFSKSAISSQICYFEV